MSESSTDGFRPSPSFQLLQSCHDSPHGAAYLTAALDKGVDRHNSTGYNDLNMEQLRLDPVITSQAVLSGASQNVADAMGANLSTQWER